MRGPRAAVCTTHERMGGQAVMRLRAVGQRLVAMPYQDLVELRGNLQ